jgi:AcrR family transcriptional regulator
MKTRSPLTKDRILETGLALADNEGVEAVTMRRVGEELGFEAMSLYRHVANKDDLLDGMLDLVLSECEFPDGDGPWFERIRRSALSVHATLRRHSWAAALLIGPRVRPVRLRYIEAFLACLRGGGFDPDRTYHAYHVLDGHIFGFTMWVIGHAAIPLHVEQAGLLDAIPWEDYPYLAEHRDQHTTDGPHQEIGSFEIGLDLLLRGLGAEC